MLNKLRSLGAATVEAAVENLETAFAKNFPNVYSEAARKQLLEMKESFGIQLIEAEKRLQKEDGDVNDVKSQMERISAQLNEGGAYSRSAYENESNPTAKEQIRTSATLLRSELQKLEARLPKEEKEAQDQRERWQRIKGMYERILSQIQDFDRQAQEAKDRLEDAQVREKDAEMRRQEAAAMSSINSAFNGMTVAMSGLNRAADEADTRARYAEMQATESASGTNVESLLKAAEQGQKVKPVDPWS